MFAPTTLARAIQRLGFVQADPIRAPARAQDLTLRHRVRGYRAGDLDRRYARLPVDEDCLVNYGFLARDHLPLMHPRTPSRALTAAEQRQMHDVLAFVRERGSAHPRDVQQAFGAARVRNDWGGQSQAGTRWLEALHYRGHLRVARREGGIKVYEPVSHPVDDRPPEAKVMALLRLVLAKYAPLPSPTLGTLARFLGYGAPQWKPQIVRALATLRATLPQASVDGLLWLWPESRHPTSARWKPPVGARLLAPFDPVVWDRVRFEALWGWPYRFEAYTPPARRTMGHYPLPLLWGDRVVGFATAEVRDEVLHVAWGRRDGGARRDPALRAALHDEASSMAVFLGLEADAFRVRPADR